MEDQILPRQSFEVEYYFTGGQLGAGLPTTVVKEKLVQTYGLEYCGLSTGNPYVGATSCFRARESPISVEAIVKTMEEIFINRKLDVKVKLLDLAI
jgi:hypothetical protein